MPKSLMELLENYEPPAGIRRRLNGAWGPTGEKSPAEARQARIEFLLKKRVGTKADLLLKFQDEDWRGVQDCGSDLRDIDSELKGLRG